MDVELSVDTHSWETLHCMKAYLFVLAEANVHTHDELGQGGVGAMAYTSHIEDPSLTVPPPCSEIRSVSEVLTHVFSTLLTTLLFDGKGSHGSKKCASLN